MQFQSTTQGSYRAPTINYSMKAVQPIKPIEMPNVELPEIDLKGIADSFSDAYKEFNKQQAIKAEEKKQKGLNDLATKSLEIVERQRQGVIKASQADTEMRALRMQALQQGFSTEDVHKVFSNYSMGIESMEEARQKKIMENDQDFMNNEVNKARNTYRSLSTKSTTEITSLLKDMSSSQQRAMEDLKQLSMLDPNSTDYAMLQDRIVDEYSTNAYYNMALELSDALTQTGEISPESVQNLKNQAIKVGVQKYGMSTDMASLSADRAIDSLGISGNLNAQKEFWEQSTEQKKAVTDYIIANSKGKLMSVAGVPEMMAIDGGRALGEAVSVQSRETITAIAKAISADNKKVEANGRVTYAASDLIDARSLPDIVRGVINMNNSPIYSPYQRGRMMSVANEAVVKNNTPSPSDTPEDLKVKGENIDNYLNLVNSGVQEQEINKIQNPEDREFMMGVLKRTKAAAINSKLMQPNVLGSDINYLNNSGVADRVRISKDGTITFARPTGVMGELYKTLNAGKYAEVRDKINEKLMRIEDPEVRKETAMQQFPAATDLGIDEDEDDMVRFSSYSKDDTPADNEERKQTFLRDLRSQQSDIPGYTGNIDLDSRPVIENEDGTVSTVVSTSIEEDGKEILIPTVRVDEDGTPIYMSLDEAINWYHATGEHLGIYKDSKEATAMGEKISARQNKVLKGSASAGGSFETTNPHIVDEGDAADISAADQEQQRVAIQTEHTVARVLVDAIRKAEPDSAEFNELMEILKRVNERLEYFNQETYDPYGEGDE